MERGRCIALARLAAYRHRRRSHPIWLRPSLMGGEDGRRCASRGELRGRAWRRVLCCGRQRHRHRSVRNEAGRLRIRFIGTAAASLRPRRRADAALGSRHGHRHHRLGGEGRLRVPPQWRPSGIAPQAADHGRQRGQPQRAVHRRNQCGRYPLKHALRPVGHEQPHAQMLVLVPGLRRRRQLRDHGRQDRGPLGQRDAGIAGHAVRTGRPGRLQARRAGRPPAGAGLAAAAQAVGVGHHGPPSRRQQFHAGDERRRDGHRSLERSLLFERGQRDRRDARFRRRRAAADQPAAADRHRPGRQRAIHAGRRRLVSRGNGQRHDCRAIRRSFRGHDRALPGSRRHPLSCRTHRSGIG